jgi:hypothetical protein
MHFGINNFPLRVFACQPRAVLLLTGPFWKYEYLLIRSDLHGNLGL